MTFKKHVDTRHGVGIILIKVKIVTKYRRVGNILETNRNIAWSRNYFLVLRKGVRERLS
jgi:hypothetical protein